MHIFTFSETLTLQTDVCDSRLYAENDRMCRFDFRCFLMDVFAMNEDLMMDRIFTFFDKKIDGTVTREEWVIGLSVVLRGELDELIAFAFFVYDLNQDGLISKEEMWCMLKDALFCPRFPEEAFLVNTYSFWEHFQPCLVQFLGAKTLSLLPQVPGGG